MASNRGVPVYRWVQTDAIWLIGLSLANGITCGTVMDDDDDDVVQCIDN